MGLPEQRVEKAGLPGAESQEVHRGGGREVRGRVSFR